MPKQQAICPSEAEIIEIATQEGLTLVRSTTSSSGYQGVSPSGSSAFQARCRGKSLGNFSTPHEAALAYARHIGATRTSRKAIATQSAFLVDKQIALASLETTLNQTGYKGVSRTNSARCPFKADIPKSVLADGQDKHVGVYPTAEEAALALAHTIGPDAVLKLSKKPDYTLLVDQEEAHSLTVGAQAEAVRIARGAGSSGHCCAKEGPLKRKMGDSASPDYYEALESGKSVEVVRRHSAELVHSGGAGRNPIAVAPAEPGSASDCAPSDVATA